MKTCDILKVRMNHLGINIKALAENSFVDEKIINKLINNELNIKDVDMIDVEFIENVLYCLPGYLTDDNVRKKDILYNSKDFENIKANNVKVKIQSLVYDLEFLNSLL